MADKEAKWICHRCHSVTYYGSANFYGEEKYYLCTRHPGGKSVSIEMANFRCRQRDARSQQRRGMSTQQYCKGLAELEKEKAKGK